MKSLALAPRGGSATFKILWGDQIGIQDDESLFDAIRGSSHISQRGAWYELDMGDGTTQKFQASRWMEYMADEKFKARVLQVMDEEVIFRFDQRQGNTADFYETDDESS